MTLFALRNLRENVATESKPWLVTSNRPGFRDKAQYIEWCRDIKSDGCFYSGFEGLSMHSRVSSQDNPPTKLHGLIIDYDANIGDEECKKALTRVVKPPTYVSTTFSNGRRFIWMFDEPLLVFGADWLKRFLTVLAKELKVARLLPGLDGCYLDPNHYYELGTDWKQIASPLEPSFLTRLVFESSNKVDWKKEGNKELIPIETLAAEVEARWPGRWPEGFKVGAQGPRFWDETADNPRACIVRETGMQCFTGDIPFLNWSQIFGRAFTKEYETRRVGDAIHDTFFDGQVYWTKDYGRWRDSKRPDILLRLKACGLSPKSDGDYASEVEKALIMIQTQKRVEFAVPYVHEPDGEIVIDGGIRVLNTSWIRALTPSDDTALEWGQKFEFVARWMDDFFEDTIQRDTFFAWLQRYYRGALAMSPKQGHIMMVGGPADKGKTLLGTRVVGGLVGGFIDASTLLSGEEKDFNSPFLASPLWTIDDGTPAATTGRYLAYSALLKKLAANRAFVYKEKYKNSAMTRWNGRVFITFNLDAESTRVIPEPDEALLEKLIIIRARHKVINFPSDVETIINRELPFFANWLLKFEPPAEIMTGRRYGVKEFHHPELLETARASTVSAGFAEVLLKVMNEENDDFTGTATDLLQLIYLNDSLKPLVHGMSSDSVGRCLSRLSSRGYKVLQGNRSAAHGGVRLWSIAKNFFPDGVEVDSEVRKLIEN